MRIFSHWSVACTTSWTLQPIREPRSGTLNLILVNNPTIAKKRNTQCSWVLIIVAIAPMQLKKSAGETDLFKIYADGLKGVKKLWELSDSSLT